MTITFGLSWDDYYQDNPDDIGELEHDDFPSDLQEEPDEQPEV